VLLSVEFLHGLLPFTLCIIIPAAYLSSPLIAYIIREREREREHFISFNKIEKNRRNLKELPNELITGASNASVLFGTTNPPSNTNSLAS
jgi:hypothetical protein